MSQPANQNSTTSQPALGTGIAAGSVCLRSDALKDWLKIVVPETIRHSFMSVEQFGYEPGKGGKAARTAEFNAGRFCAQQALSTWNQDGPVGKADDRSPIWPEGFTGSISHSKNWVWASVAKSDQVLSVGITPKPSLMRQRDLKHGSKSQRSTNYEPWKLSISIRPLSSLFCFQPKKRFTNAGIRFPSSTLISKTLSSNHASPDS